ncbi:MAG: hypothetical protein V1706_08185, partial [Pseudomonadota bacterium]
LSSTTAALSSTGSITDSANALISVSGQGVLNSGSSITLGDTGTDNVNFGSLDATAGASVAISEDSDMVVDRLSAAGANLASTGSITDSANALISVSGQGVLNSGSAITLGDTGTDSVNFGSLDATAVSAVVISENSDMVVDRLSAATAALSSTGSITDSANALIAVSDQGVLNAGSAITLGDTATDSVNFGSLDATAVTAVAISEDSDMIVDRLSAATAALSSTGSITDSANALISVSGQGVLHAGSAITLGDTGTDSVNFGSLDATAVTAVAISEDSDMVVDRLSAATAALSSTGSITDSANALISVSDQGVLNAGSAITLGDTATDSVNFGSLDATAVTAVAISEDSDMVVDRLSAATAALSSTGSITDSANAMIAVSGQGVLHAGSAITLGDTATDSVNFGSLDATAVTAVAINEDSDMVVDRLSAANAALSSTGSITDSANALIAVSDQGVLNAGSAITLGDTGTDSVNFGSLDATAVTAVAISEDSDMVVDRLSAANAALTSTGSITDSANALIAVSGQGVLNAGSAITLGDTGTDNVNFGSLDATSVTAVAISEDSDMVVDGLSATTVALTSTGSITDSANALISVSDQGVLNAGSSIALGDTGADNVNFGSLHATAVSAVAISENSDMVVDRLSAATAALTSTGSITDSANATIAVSGQGVLHAGSSITLGDTATDSVNFGSLHATAVTAVSINEDSAMVVDGLSATTAALTSTGSITDSANATIAVSDQGVLHAVSAITLGDTGTDSVNFGSLDATAGSSVTIREDSNMVVDRLSAASATLASTGSITDSANATIAVGGKGTLNASGSITLGDTATDSVNFGSISATAGASASITENSNMIIERLSAVSAHLKSTGNITDSVSGAIDVSGLGTLNAGGLITLGDTTTDRVNFGSIDAAAVSTIVITEDSDMTIQRLIVPKAHMTSTGILSANTVTSDNITFVADEINLTGGAGSIVGHDIFLEPLSKNQNITIAGAADAGNGSLDLTTTDLAALKDGFSTITIGRVDGSGQMYIPYNQFEWRDPVIFNAPDSGIVTDDVYDFVTETYAENPDSYNIFSGAGDASFAFMSDSPTTFWLNGNIKTSVGDVFIDSDITTILRPGDISISTKVAESFIAIDTDGGNIQFGSMVGYTTYLMLLAGIDEAAVDGGTINGAVEVYGLRLSGSGGELGVKITSVDNVYSQDKWPAVYTIVTLPAPHYGAFTFNDLPVRGLPIDRDPQNAFLLGMVTFFGVSNDLFSIESYALPEGYSEEGDDEEDEDEASDTTPSEAGFGLTGSGDEAE